MCSIGPLHQVYVFQHTFNDADIEAKPLQQPNTTRGGLVPSTSFLNSDNEQVTTRPMSSRHDDSARYTTVSDTDRSLRKGRTESSGDELPRTDRRNRRLAVVNKILDEMDDVIVSEYFLSFEIIILLFRIQDLNQIVVEIQSQNMVAVILCLVQLNVMFPRIKVDEISLHLVIILIQVDHLWLVHYVI